MQVGVEFRIMKVARFIAFLPGILFAQLAMLGIVTAQPPGVAEAERAGTAVDTDRAAGTSTTAADVPPETNAARADINDSYLDPEMNVEEWIARFEVESREVYAARDDILKAMALQPGGRVADVGAGTGFYAVLFANDVGKTGWVYAVDISPRFAQHLVGQSTEAEHPNISVVLCNQQSIMLPPNSVDVVFCSDTYHHFTSPAETLASIHTALRPDGSFFVLDFERIPGVSREWTIGHVRAGKQTVIGEIEEAGFRLVREFSIPALSENYFLRFRKQ